MKMDITSDVVVAEFITSGLSCGQQNYFMPDYLPAH
jgi:hypothetical protein